MTTSTRSRIVAATALALTLVVFSGCSSDSSSDGDSATTAAGSTELDAATADEINAACKTTETEVEAAKKAAEAAPVDEAGKLEQQGLEDAATQFTTLSSAVASAGGSGEDLTKLTDTLAKIPAAYTALAEASVQVNDGTDLSSDPTLTAEVEKKVEAATDPLVDDIADAQKASEDLGLTDCTALFKELDLGA